MAILPQYDFLNTLFMRNLEVYLNFLVSYTHILRQFGDDSTIVLL